MSGFTKALLHTRVLALIAVIASGPLLAQSEGESNGLRERSMRRPGAFELRAGFGDGIFLALELRYWWLEMLSSDAFASIGPSDLGAGLTFWPVPECGIQGSIALSTYSDAQIDRPPFEADFAVGANAVLRFPFGRAGSSIFAVMTFGVSEYIDRHYCSNCALGADPGTFRPTYETAARRQGRLSVGLGRMF